MRYASGALYKGQWRDDMRNGLGTYYFTTGERMTGNYTDNKENGDFAYYEDVYRFNHTLRKYKNG